MMRFLWRLFPTDSDAACAQCGKQMRTDAMVRWSWAYCCSEEHAQEYWAKAWL